MSVNCGWPKYLAVQTIKLHAVVGSKTSVQKTTEPKVCNFKYIEFILQIVYKKLAKLNT